MLKSILVLVYLSASAYFVRFDVNPAPLLDVMGLISAFKAFIAVPSGLPAREGAY